jgi:translation elongation factor EF-4
VTTICDGGDVTRKKRMREFGRVANPQDAFIAALKMDEN